MNRKQGIWMIVPFLTIVFGFTFLRYIKPDYYESSAENRLLAQKPIKGKTGDETYSEAYEKYVTDQFPMRDRMLRLHMNSEIIMNKTDIKGYYLQDEEWIFEKSDLRLSDEAAKMCGDVVNKYGEIITSRGKEFYYASTPQKENILVDRMPKYSNLNVLLSNRERFLNGLDPKVVNLIDLRSSFINTLSSEELDSIYFKSDNHWNGLGGYLGFKVIMDGMGVKINDSDYTFKKLENRDFQGIYNQNLYNIYPGKEDIDYVYRKNSNEREYYLNNGGVFEKVNQDKIVGTGVKGESITYSTAYTSSSIHYKVINKNPLIDKKLLIFRDSYHSAMSWLYEDIYREVEVVDPRYILKSKTTCQEIAKTTDADIVLMMYNDFGFITMLSEME